MLLDRDEFGPPDKWPERPKRHAKPADVERCLREGRHCCIESLEEAATKDGAARYPIDLDPDQQGGSKNHVLPLLAATAPRSQREACAEQGDSPEAGRAIRAILGLARSLERQPLLLPLLTRHVIETNGCGRIAHCIPKVQFSAADLAAFDKALAHADEQAEIVTAISGERLTAIVLVQEDFRLATGPRRQRHCTRIRA